MRSVSLNPATFSGTRYKNNPWTGYYQPIGNNVPLCFRTEKDRDEYMHRTRLEARSDVPGARIPFQRAAGLVEKALCEVVSADGYLQLEKQGYIGMYRDRNFFRIVWDVGERKRISKVLMDLRRKLPMFKVDVELVDREGEESNKR